MESKLKEKLTTLLKNVSNKNGKKIVEMRFGIKDDKPKTIDEISKMLKISREEVINIEKETLKELKRM